MLKGAKTEFRPLGWTTNKTEPNRKISKTSLLSAHSPRKFGTFLLERTPKERNCIIKENLGYLKYRFSWRQNTSHQPLRDTNTNNEN